MSGENELGRVESLLEEIVRLLAGDMVAGRKQIEAIELLWRCGLAPKRIGGLVGTSAAVVSVTIGRVKKRPKNK